MSEETKDEKLVPETPEEQKLVDKLASMRESKKIDEFITRTGFVADGMGVDFKKRIKEDESALKKFRGKGYQTADRMGDLLGIMFVTGNEEQIYKAAQYMESQLENTQSDDYVKNPKDSGYRSYHINSVMDVPDVNGPVSLEAQIKTEPMSIAQDTTHDSIYKNDTLSMDVRNKLSSVMFPVIETLVEIDLAKKNEDFKRVVQLQTKKDELLLSNSELLEEYKDVIDSVWKEYGKVRFKHNNENKIGKEEFLKVETKAERDRRMKEFDNTLDNFFDSYCGKATEIGVQDESISGNAIFDYAIREIQGLDYDRFRQDLLNQHEINNRESDVKDAESAKVTNQILGNIDNVQEPITNEDNRELNNNSQQKTVLTKAIEVLKTVADNIIQFVKKNILRQPEIFRLGTREDITHTQTEDIKEGLENTFDRYICEEEVVEATIKVGLGIERDANNKNDIDNKDKDDKADER